MSRTDRLAMDDLRYISNPDLWVQLLCPIKKCDERGQPREFAYLFGPEPVIKMGNMFMPKESDPEIRFGSHRAILDAGWEVD